MNFFETVSAVISATARSTEEILHLINREKVVDVPFRNEKLIIIENHIKKLKKRIKNEENCKI